MCSDHRHPGSAIVLAIVTSPRVTMASLPFSKTRDSSGLRNVLTSIPGIASSRAGGHVERLVASLRSPRAKTVFRVMGSGRRPEALRRPELLDRLEERRTILHEREVAGARNHDDLGTGDPIGDELPKLPGDRIGFA